MLHITYILRILLLENNNNIICNKLPRYYIILFDNNNSFRSVTFICVKMRYTYNIVDRFRKIESMYNAAVAAK